MSDEAYTALQEAVRRGTEAQLDRQFEQTLREQEERLRREVEAAAIEDLQVQCRV